MLNVKKAFVEWPKGDKAWFFNGKEVTEEEHKRLTSKSIKHKSKDKYGKNKICSGKHAS